MEPTINDQFEQWKKKDTKETIAEEITDIDTEESAEDVEQVSRNLFEFTENHNDNTEVHDNKKENNDETSTQKTSFTELRHGKKIPRLKKSMVLAIITGGTFVFLLIVNLIIQKKEDQKNYFDEPGNNLAVGNTFSLGDMGRRPMQTNTIGYEVIEDNHLFFRTPPAYTPAPEPRIASVSPGMSAPVSSGAYSESDLLAMRAQIGKDGGYGTVRAANYTLSNATALDAASLAAAPWGHIPSREEYTRQRIDEIASLTQAANGGMQAAPDRSNTGRFSDAGSYNPDNTQAGTNVLYLNDNCLFPGTIIHAILVSRIDTDYPGPIHARVTENVYDSMTGKNLLIPQGTILQGNYSSSSFGVAKVQIAWESMVVNYRGIAYQVSLGGMAGVDKRGRAGISGSLDDHYFEWLKAAGIVSLFTILNSEIAYQTREQSPQIRELIDVNQGIVNQVGGRLMERAMNIQPTVRVPNGTALSVAVNAPIQLRPFPAIRVEERYVRRK